MYSKRPKTRFPHSETFAHSQNIQKICQSNSKGRNQYSAKRLWSSVLKHEQREKLTAYQAVNSLYSERYL